MKLVSLLFAFLLPVAAIAQAPPNQAPDRTWITDVRIISPEKLDHTEKGSVLIENGRNTPAASMSVPSCPRLGHLLELFGMATETE